MPAGAEQIAEVTFSQAFDLIFWPAYPRKTAKHYARKAWLKLKLADSDQATLDHIMRGLQHYRDHEWDLERGKRYVPMASTWLNQRRWEDIE